MTERSTQHIAGLIIALIAMMALLVLIVGIFRSAGVTARDIAVDNWLTGLILVVSATLIATFMRGMRWLVLMGEHAPASRQQMLAGHGWCFLLQSVLPFRSGEISRPVWIKQRGGSATYTAATILFERIADIIVLGLTLTVCALIAGMESDYLPTFDMPFGSRTVLVVATIGGVLVIILSTAMWFSPENLRQRYRAAIAAELTKFSTMFTPATVVQFAALTLLIWSVLGIAFASFFSLALPQGTVPAVVTGFLVLAGTNLAGVVSPIPGNLGLFEAVGVAVLAIAGHQIAEALPIVVLLHLSVLLGQALYGTCCRINIRPVRF